MLTLILSLFLSFLCGAHILLLLVTDPGFPDYFIPLMLYYFMVLPILGSVTLLPYPRLLRAHKEKFFPVISGMIHAGLHLLLCTTLLRRVLPASVCLCACGIGLLFSAVFAILFAEDDRPAAPAPRPGVYSDAAPPFPPAPEDARTTLQVRVCPAPPQKKPCTKNRSSAASRPRGSAHDVPRFQIRRT